MKLVRADSETAWVILLLTFFGAIIVGGEFWIVFVINLLLMFWPYIKREYKINKLVNEIYIAEDKRFSKEQIKKEIKSRL